MWIGAGTMVALVVVAWWCAASSASRRRPVRFGSAQEIGDNTVVAIDCRGGAAADLILVRPADGRGWLLLDAAPPHRLVSRQSWPTLEDASTAVRAAVERPSRPRPRIGRTIARGLVVAGDVRAASRGPGALGRRLVRRAAWRALWRL